MFESSPAAQFAAWLVAVDERLKRLEHHADLSDAVTDADGEISAADIRAAYRLLLNREPDPTGFADYLARAAAGFARGDLVAELLESDERATIAARNLAQVDVGGVLVSVDRTEREFGGTIAAGGIWEPHIVAQITRHLQPGAVFVDIGANVGVMSFHAARTVGPKGKVIAFEPNPDNIQRFLEGQLANGFAQVRLVPMAASAEKSIFAIKGSSNTYLAAPGAGMRLVQALAADEVLGTEPRIDMIKIDIEGHEPLAIAGLARTIARHAPLILCEFNPRCLQATAETPPERFAANLFEIAGQMEIIEHDGGMTPVEDPDALMRLWAQRNAWHVEMGNLPDGMVHFDLWLRPRSASGSAR